MTIIGWMRDVPTGTSTSTAEPTAQKKSCTLVKWATESCAEAHRLAKKHGSASANARDATAKPTEADVFGDDSALL